MRTRAAVLAALIVGLSASSVAALDIYLAPIVYQDEGKAEAAGGSAPAGDLAKRLGPDRLGDRVSVRLLPAASTAAPQTFIDAARLCESQSCPYMLYGYVKKTSYSYYAEIKLIAHEDKQVVTVFIAADDGDHYERLIDDLSAKIVQYIRGDLGIGPPLPRELPARNLLVLPSSLGYWTPMGGEWSSALAGLVSASSGIRLIPQRPLYSLFSRSCYLAVGVDLEYQLGMNQPGLESFFLHMARLRIPAESFMDLGNGHEIGLGLGPLFEVDVMNQAHEYGQAETKATVVPGFSVEALYRYALSEGLSLGMTNIVDVALYSRALFTYSPRLTLVVHLGQQGGGQKP